MVKLGLRKDFLIHRKKTIDSFQMVRADVTSISLSLETIKNMLSSIESRISGLESEALGMRQSLERCSSGISMQQAESLSIQSKIEGINGSIQNAVAKVNSFKGRVGSLVSKSQQISRAVSKNSNSIKKMLPRLRKQSLQARKLKSALRVSQEEAKKLRNLINRKLRTAKRADSELEKKLRSQRTRIAQLNRKIEGSKVARRIVRKIIKKKTTPKKTIKKTITPKKTITKTITPKRTVTKTVTPKKQKNALNFIKTEVLEKYGSTGVQKVLDIAVFELLKYIAIFPGGVNKLADQHGNVIPDCFLMPQNTTALDFAFRLHTDIGNHFIKAIDVRTKKPVGKDYLLKNRDVIEIVTSK